jgi:hypothetical protein
MAAAVLLGLVLAGCAGQGAGTEPSSAVEVTTEQEKTVNEIYDEILSEVELPSMVVMNDNYISNYFSIDLSLLDEYVVANAEDVIYADTIMILKMKNPESAGALEDSLEAMLEQKKLELKNYLPEQYAIVEASEIKIAGNYIYLVVSDQEDDILAVIQEYMN